MKNIKKNLKATALVMVSLFLVGMTGMQTFAIESEANIETQTNENESTIENNNDIIESNQNMVGTPKALGDLHLVVFATEDGDMGDWEMIEVPEGDLVPNVATIPEKAEYTFIGWAYSFTIDDEPILWNFDVDVMPDQSMTLWAAYKEITYTVTFNTEN